MSDREVSNPLEEIEFADMEIPEAVAAMFEVAVDARFSDLFFIANETDLGLAVRHLGIFKSFTSVSPDLGRRYINHVKASAGMDLAQRVRPQDGRWIYHANSGRKVDLRINTIPTMFGEDMTIRLLDRDLGLLELKNLGFHRKQYEDLLALLNSPSGLLLVCGPTGAGKTTTLYTCLQSLSNGRRKINTIEDPIEFSLSGVRQSQVNAKIDLDFPELLRSILRQAPDIIMVGEIRDPVTAQTAVRAANSGHLVLATLHAPTAAGAIDSMLALGVIPHFLATGLLGVVSQRLVRKLCEHCKVAFELIDAPETFGDVRKLLEPGQGERIYSAPGCDQCFFEGYNDRTGVMEVLRMTGDIRRMIFDRRPAREIRDKAIEQGMIDLRRAALLKVAQGVTSMEEVVRVIPTEHLLPHD